MSTMKWHVERTLGSYRVADENGSSVASIASGPNSEAVADLIANAPAMLEALLAICKSAVDAERERGGRITFNPASGEALRQLMIKYGAPDGGADQLAQIAFVALAVIDKLKGKGE